VLLYYFTVSLEFDLSYTIMYQQSVYITNIKGETTIGA